MASRKHVQDLSNINKNANNVNVSQWMKELEDMNNIIVGGCLNNTCKCQSSLTFSNIQI